MSVEPIIAPIHQPEPVVHLAQTGAERPTPSMEQEQVADTVFTREQTQLAAVVMGLQTGLALAHYLAVETFGDAAQEEEKPRRRPTLKEEPVH